MSSTLVLATGLVFLLVKTASTQSTCHPILGNCKNGGSCVNERCTCPGSYFGIICQYKNTEPCTNAMGGQPDSCLNGGDCRGVCECEKFYYGPTCEEVCPGSPLLCKNGGQCREDPQVSDGFRCICINDYTGKFCEKPKVCSQSSCQNGGSPSNTSDPQGLVCICSPGYAGPCCQDLDHCRSNPCVNAVCVSEPDNYICSCVPGYIGVNCQNPVLPPPGCNPPCLNGGSCTGTTCTCTMDWAGPQCQDPMMSGANQCDSSPCMNGGTCINGIGQFSCMCPPSLLPSFTSLQCEVSICLSNLCLNGGICSESSTDPFYNCDCAPGFSGQSCENSNTQPGGNDGGQDGNGGGVSFGVIIGAAAAGGAVLIPLFIVLVCCCRRRSSHSSAASKSKKMVPALEEGNNSHPLQKVNTYVELDQRTTMEFPRVNLRMMDHIGSGSFAEVYKAEAYAIRKPKKVTVVAVKVLKEDASENDRKDFMKELSLYKTLGKHRNVVNMYGCCTDKDPVYLIMEYLHKGNLQQHLRDLAKNKTSDGDPYMNSIPGNHLTPSELLKFGIDIAKGMEFIDSKKCVHRDLAARNVLLGGESQCKIADFGLARDVSDSAKYEMKSKSRVPVRWMAPESLMQNIYTSKTDAWSFGIVMWEIITLGSHPYPGMSPRQVMQGVLNGYRLPKPDHCAEEIYSKIEQCWEHDPANRPTFTEMKTTLEELMKIDQGYLQMDNFNQDDYVYLKPGDEAEEEL